MNCQATLPPSDSARAPVVHGDRAAAERRRRDQLEPSRAREPALVQGRAVAGDPGVYEEPVLVDQVQPIQLGRKRSEEHTYELQSLMRISYAVFCLEKQKITSLDNSNKSAT